MSPPPIPPHLHQVRTFVELLAHQGHDKLQLTSVRAVNPHFKKANKRALVRPFCVERAVFQGDAPKSSALHQSSNSKTTCLEVLNFLTPSTEIATFWTTQIFILLPILGTLQQVDSHPSESLSMFETHTVPCSTDLWFRLLWRCHMSISPNFSITPENPRELFHVHRKAKVWRLHYFETHLYSDQIIPINHHISHPKKPQATSSRWVQLCQFQLSWTNGAPPFCQQNDHSFIEGTARFIFSRILCLRFCKPWIFMSSCSQQLVAQNVYSPHHINGWF